MAKKLNNDSVILELKKQIEQKKKDLRGVENFKPVTNCSLMIGPDRVNLHAANEELLTGTLVQINAIRMSAADLGISFTYQGFTAEDWISDIKAKLLILNKRNEETRLKVLETKLTDLLSAEKKTELVINELKDLI